MEIGRTTILDGTLPDDPQAARIRDLTVEVCRNSGCSVVLYQMAQIRIAHCIGCFGCWVKTPGECVHNDSGRQIARDVINSDRLVLLSPVLFGGYSAALKYAVDRLIPLIHPDIMMRHGEIHHRPRYERYPRIVGVGLQIGHDEKSARIFEMLVGRNAINLHSPSHAAGVISTDEDDEVLRTRIAGLMTREDLPPESSAMISLMRELIPEKVPDNLRAGERQALLLVGSPKTGSSTSEVLGLHFAGLLEKTGWKTRTIKIRERWFGGAGPAELRSALENADLILAAFPLYADSVPALVAKTFEELQEMGNKASKTDSRRFFVIANNGFPEAYQNAPALAICRNFAEKAGMAWAGYMAVGAGEAVSGGRPLEGKQRRGPPVFRLIEAFESAASMLERDGFVSGKPLKAIQKSPIPLLPFPIWRRMFIHFASAYWRKRASGHGVKKRQMNAKPYVSL